MFINSKRSISPVDYIAFNVKLATTSDFFFFLNNCQLALGFQKYFLSILVGEGKLGIAFKLCTFTPHNLY